MATDPNILDELLKSCKSPDDVDNLHAQFLQRLINRALDTEMDSHLGYGKGERTENQRRTNTRNEKTGKTVNGTFGALEIPTPRDREGRFEPQLMQNVRSAWRTWKAIF